MAVSYVAGAQAGNGQTAVTASLAVTIPAAASVGDYATVQVISNKQGSTAPTPTGWTLLSGGDSIGTSTEAWLFGKTLVSGDPGSSVTFTLSTSGRMVATCAVATGVTATGMLVATPVISSASTTSLTLPTQTGVPAGAFLLGFASGQTATTTTQTYTAATGYTNGTYAGTAYTTLPEVASQPMYKVVGAAGTYGGETVTASTSATALAYLVALPASSGGTAATASGSIALGGTATPGAVATSTGTVTLAATAPATGAATASGTVALAGSISAAAPAATAGVIYLGGEGRTPAPTTAIGTLLYAQPGQYPYPGLYPGSKPTGGTASAGLPVTAAELFKQAIRGPVAITYTVDASLGGSAITGAQGMAPVGGTITDTSAPGVRRVLSLDLAPSPGLFDLLSPSGVRLNVTAHVRYTSRAVFDLAMGVFDVDTETLKEGGGGLSLTAPDKWVRIMRAKFVTPQASIRNATVVQQIKSLIQGALGVSEPVVIAATSTAKVGAMVWDSDRAQAIIDLAKGIGAWVFFDRAGTATIADIPTIGTAADWLVDSSASGVMLSMDRTRSRTSTYNVVAVHSTAAAAPAFPDQYVWDTDPASPTYAGTDPIRHPELAGPFGVSVYHFDTPLPLTVSGARRAGYTVLARTTGLAAQASMGQVPNPAVDAMDVLDVLAPRERRDLPRAVERHMVDTVTHSLDVTQPQTMQTRSTRTDAFT